MSRRRTAIDEGVNGTVNRVTWDEAVESFLDSLKIRGLSYHTRRWHKENFQAVYKMLKEHEFALDPSLITEFMLREIVLKMVDRGLSPTTINHRVRSLKQFYSYLLSEGLVDNNPVKRMEKQKVRKKIIETFSEEQILKILEAPDKKRFVGFRDYTIMLLLLDTGIRLSELVGLKLEDIKMAQSELIVTEGKGGKQRRVFFSPKAKETLRKYLKIRGDISGNPYLFVTVEDLPIKQRNVQERLSIYGQKVKLEGVRVSPHTFRHTFAKMYILRGGDAFSLQALLGHSTLDMVKNYVNLWGSDLQKMHRQYSPVDYLLR